MKTFTPQLESCRIVVKNEVFGSYEEFDTPQSVDEAMDSHGAVNLAGDWWIHSIGEDEPIAVAIHKKPNEITVHWFPTTDDTDAARAAMQAALSGDWRVDA